MSRRGLAAIGGALLLSACGHHAAARHDDAAARAGPDPHELDPSRAPAGAAGQYAKLEWERPGDWHVVNVDRRDGSRDTMLVARDPFGDRIIAARAGGYAIWRGKIVCPQGRATMIEGALFVPHARHATPAGTFMVDDASAHVLCDGPGEIMTGTPAQVSKLARSFFPPKTLDFNRPGPVATRHSAGGPPHP